MNVKTMVKKKKEHYRICRIANYKVMIVGSEEDWVQER